MADAYPGHYMVKFFRHPGYYRRSMQRIASDLGLIGGTRGLRILDIGCGVGFFVSACREAGHDAMGIDLPDRVLQRAASINGTPYLVHRVQIDEPLPEHLLSLDRVTIFGVNFRHADDSRWTWVDFRCLLTDLWPRLNSGGELILRPNIREAATNFVLDSGLWQSELGNEAAYYSNMHQIRIRKI